MTDLKELLERASEPATIGAVPVADDLARGRKALHKRRAGMAGGVLAAAVLVTGAGGFAVARSSATPGEVSPAAHASSSPRVSPFTGSIGQSPFKLSFVPAGWKVQGWSPSAVTLVHADGSPHTTVQDFEGKIAILNSTTPIPQTGTVKTVDGKRFRVTEYPAGDSLPATPVVSSVSPSYHHAYLQVQGPKGTDPAQLLKIAAGATATGDGTPAIG